MRQVFRTMTIVGVALIAWWEPTACRCQSPSSPPAPLPLPRRVQEGAPQPSFGGPMPANSAGLTANGTAVSLQPAPLEEGDVRLPITLATAIRLADDRPLLVVAAQASVWVAEAQLQRAKLLWIPTLNIGGDYVRHDGFGPDFNRGINTLARPLNNNINFLYAGGGMTMDVATTDAIFQPLAARQVLNARRFDIQAVKNDSTLQAAQAYFEVHRYRGMYAGALDCVSRGRLLVQRIRDLSKDLVPKIEVNRAERMLADLEQQATMARQSWREASAELTRVLRLDPRAVIVPLEHDHLQLTLIDPARSLDELIPIGLTMRPELASVQALVQATLVRIRQEKLRPWIPSVLLNGFQTPEELLQVGAQGIGSGGKLNLWSARDDFSPQLLWRLEGMGFGNLARVRERRGEQSQAIIQLFRVQDLIAHDITQIQARLQSAAARSLQAERSLQQAIITYNGNYEGLRQTKQFGNLLVQVYRPQEAVISLEDLRNSYDMYFTTVADYNRAQFQMFHALGFPAREISYLRPPGADVPVDTMRPGYLPPVGKGPPPATR